MLQHTHGSCLSHLSLDALHLEQDRVSLRALDSKAGAALVPASPCITLSASIVSGRIETKARRLSFAQYMVFGCSVVVVFRSVQVS